MTKQRQQKQQQKQQQYQLKGTCMVLIWEAGNGGASFVRQT